MELRADIKQALDKFAARYGRCWKDKLRTAWCNGNYPDMAEDVHLLQQARNIYGPAMLNKYKASK